MFLCFPEEARVKFEEEEKIRKAREKEAEAERKKLENAVSYLPNKHAFFIQMNTMLYLPGLSVVRCQFHDH